MSKSKSATPTKEPSRPQPRVGLEEITEVAVGAVLRALEAREFKPRPDPWQNPIITIGIIAIPERFGEFVQGAGIKETGVA